MHVVLVSEDLELFAHLHPEDYAHNAAYLTPYPGEAPAHFTLPVSLPRAGSYLLALNYVVNLTSLGMDVPEEAPHSHAGGFLSVPVATQVDVEVTTAGLLQMAPTPVTVWDGRFTLTVPGAAMQANQVMTSTLSLLDEQARCCAVRVRLAFCCAKPLPWHVNALER
jgi:hypothetical protein